MDRPATWLTLDWWKRNIDSVSVIIVVIAMSVLGTINVISPEIVIQSLPAILGVLAFTMLRDRSRSHLGDRQLESMSGVVHRIDRKIDDLSSLRTLTGADIGEALTEARRDTGIWVFRGGTGTYTRIVTLPECIDNARADRRLLQVRLEILNPADPGACDEYAALYRRLAVGPEDDAATWTGEGTRRESYATVLAACIHKQRYPALNIEVGLSSNISTFRYDMCSQYLVVTQRGPRFQALLVEQGKPYYDYWRFELDMSFNQSRQLPIAAAVSKFSFSNLPDVDEARKIFQELRVDLPPEYTDNDVREIIESAVAPRGDVPVRGAGELVAQRVH